MASCSRCSSWLLRRPTRIRWLSTSRLAGDESDAYLLGAHLEAEDGHSSQLFGCVAGDVEGERALAEAGPRSDDDEIGALESAAEQLVEVGEAGCDRREVNVAVGLQGCRLFHVLVEDLADMHEVARAARRADAIEEVFGLGEDGLGVGRFPRRRGPAMSSATLMRRRMRDVRWTMMAVVLDVHGRRHGADEMREVGRAADVFQAFAQDEFLRDGHLVDGLAAVEQGDTRLEAPAGSW